VEREKTKKMSTNIKQNLLTPEQVAEILQIHILTVYHYIRQGKLRAIRLGRSYRIAPQDLDLLIENNRVKDVTIDQTRGEN
jgi:excisionase family DNA binding protein